MAATNWALYTTAKKKLGNGTIQLGVHPLYMHLYKGSSNASTGSATISIQSDITNIVAGGGYEGRKAVGSVTWTVSTADAVLDGAAAVWTATGGAISSISFAVILSSAGASGSSHALCRSLLTTSTQVTTGNTITVTPDAAGIFKLV